MNKIIIAIDSFKGCITSAEANRAAADGMRHLKDTEIVEIPVSDGGDGWLEAFRCAKGGELVQVTVRDPLMRRIAAPYLVQGKTAVIETAKASGLTLLAPEERNPMVATSYGTGQLIVNAVQRGCQHILVGLGGSATSDCGIGMLRAIIDAFAKGESWKGVRALDNIRFTIATDVTNPLCGTNGAAHVFAPQKGASQEMVLALDGRAKKFADKSSQHFGYDLQNMPGAGAAGGLGYAFLQYMHAECRSGIDLLLDAVNFDSLLEGADWVITGEGSADKQTLMGKLPYGILQRAQKFHVPVTLFAGRLKDKQSLLNAGFSQVVCINPPTLSIEEAMKPEVAKRNIKMEVLKGTVMPSMISATATGR